MAVGEGEEGMDLSTVEAQSPRDLVSSWLCGMVMKRDREPGWLPGFQLV